MILQPVKAIIVTALSSDTAAELASAKVIAKQRRGRHAITVKGGTGGINIGGSDVTSASNNYALASGETLTIPLDTMRSDAIYYVGTGTLIEYF